ncbi:MAG: hypothetical protein PHS92_00630 [Candidatus Gracilibacteria bacterium]|nr:hypothetical protein [Candidatus Gracilibacteria bacterium]
MMARKNILGNISDRKGSALIITLFLTIIISLIAIYLLDKIMPISQSVKGIENSNMAYYNGFTGVEKALFAMTGANPAYESGANTHLTTATGYIFQITASGNVIPRPGEGNSEYSTGEWNAVGPGRPVQLVINKSGIDWDSVNFTFRVPDLNGDGTQESLSGTLAGSGYINWILSGSGKTLFASGETGMINGTTINSASAISLSAREGLDLNGSGGTLKQFYNSTSPFFIPSTGLGTNGADCSTNKCTLKFSMVNSLILSDGKLAPYLEYKITFNPLLPIPLQYAKIESDGYSYGFKKHIRRDVEQITTNETIDFTVFQ